MLRYYGNDMEEYRRLCRWEYNIKIHLKETDVKMDELAFKPFEFHNSNCRKRDKWLWPIWYILVKHCAIMLTVEMYRSEVFYVCDQKQ